MLTNIYLVRHAHSTYTTDEIRRPLSPKGIEDAKRVTEILSRENIDHFISSPFRRAVQTLEGAAYVLNFNIELDDGFREKRLAEGAVEDFDGVVQRAWEDLSFSLPGGESGLEAQERGVRSLKNVLVRHSGGNIAIGTHGNIMVLIMNYFDKRYGYDFWRELKMPDICKLSFKNEDFLGACLIRDKGK